MVYGIDFGTSNTVVSAWRDGSHRLVPLGQDGEVLPSLMFLDEDGRLEIGSAARAAYADSLGRGGAPRFRFFQGLKFALRDPYFAGTKLFGRRWSAEQLVGAFLRRARKLADEASGGGAEAVVLGRPVTLSGNADDETTLEARYREACALAGLPDPVFVLEPVAAANSLAPGTDGVSLVFDFGGGTLDLAVTETRTGRTRVVSAAGADIGGYALNEDLSRARVIRHFGYGSTFRTMTGRDLEIPDWIVKQVASFYALPLADVARTKDAIRDLLFEAKDRRKLLGLVDFLDRSLAYSLFERIDEAKARLSTRDSAAIAFEVPPHVAFDELVSRDEFEDCVAGRVEAARELTLEALRKAGLDAASVDRVVRVGGSSRVPSFRRMLESLFPGRVTEGEVFTSVASGLVRAWKDGLALEPRSAIPLRRTAAGSPPS